MTYKESEYPIIISTFEKVIQEYSDNPLIGFEIIKVLLKIYKKLPVHPNMISLSSYQILSDTDEIEKDDIVIVEGKNGKNYYSGVVKEISEEGIKVSDAFKISQYNTKLIKESNIEKLKKIDKDVIYKIWPELKDLEVEYNA